MIKLKHAEYVVDCSTDELKEYRYVFNNGHRAIVKIQEKRVRGYVKVITQVANKLTQDFAQLPNGLSIIDDITRQEIENILDEIKELPEREGEYYEQTNTK